MQAIFASSTQCTFHAPYPADSFIKKETEWKCSEIIVLTVLFGWWRAVGAQSHCDTVNSREVIVLYWSGIYYFSVMAGIRSLWGTDLH